MKCAIFGLTLHTPTIYFLQELYKKAYKEKIEIYLYSHFQKQLEKTTQFDYSRFETFSNYEDLQQLAPDLFITFGGDGTILSAVTYVRDLQIPIIGVNTGRLGFLASINQKEFLYQIDDFLHFNFVKSERSLLELMPPHTIDCPIALNEFTLSRKETTSMITINTFVNGEFLNTFWADGLIISTPTGSTGYSLSTGGPIISPDNNSIVITPIAPHNLNVRPLIINDAAEIKLQVSSRVKEFSLSLDSRLYSMPVSQELIIRKAQFPILLAQSNNYNFYSTLRDKLNWGYDLRN